MPSLPKHILNLLSTNKTSLGKHPAFPPDRDDMFTTYLLQETFDELCDKVDDIDYKTMKDELARIIGECKKIERKNKEALEQLCGKIINDIFQIPNDCIDLQIFLVDNVDVSNQRILPEKTNDFSFDNIQDMNNLSSEIYKRRILNSLVEGASMYYMNYFKKYINELYEINADLPSLYKKIIDYNNILIYCEKDHINKENIGNAGKVDVVISSRDTYPSIKAEGILMPILLEETIKGLLELSISNGLPEDFEKAKYVISKSDFKLAEMWDMRIGYPLWKLIENGMKDCGYEMTEVGINFFLMQLSEMDYETLNNSLQEIFAKTKKGKEILSDIADEILYEKDKDEFDDYIRTKNDSTVQLNDDDCFDAEELLWDNDDEECFTADELINDDIGHNLSPRINQKNNWDWIESEKPRKYRTFDERLDEVKKNLTEAEWNYHFSGKSNREHDMRPTYVPLLV